MRAEEHQSARNLSDCCATLYKLVMLQFVIYTALAWTEHNWLRLLWLIEPFILLVLVATLKNEKNHDVALVIFCYLIVLIGVWLTKVFLAFAENVPHAELTELVEPAHHLKEYFEIYVLGASWHAVALTRKAPNAPDGTIAH